MILLDFLKSIVIYIRQLFQSKNKGLNMSKKDQQEVKLIAHGYGRPLTPEERTALGEAAERSAYFSKYGAEAIRKKLTDEQAQGIRQSFNPEQQAIFDQIQAAHLISERNPYQAFVSVSASALEDEFGGRSNPNIYAVLKAIIESESESESESE